jgi:hypothetical protein
LISGAEVSVAHQQDAERNGEKRKAYEQYDEDRTIEETLPRFYSVQFRPAEPASPNHLLSPE